MKKMFLALILISNLCFGVSIEDGYKAYDNEDYKTALKIFEELAHKGDAEAIYNIAAMYADGKGLRQNFEKSFEYMTKSANGGYERAQYLLGYMYREGMGVKKDDKKAIEWYIKAANVGYLDAQFDLAIMYQYGNLVEQDYNKAIELYEKAGKQGFAPAYVNLAAFYYDIKKYKESKEYYGLACDNGDQLGCDEYKRLNSQGY